MMCGFLTIVTHFAPHHFYRVVILEILSKQRARVLGFFTQGTVLAFAVPFTWVPSLFPHRKKRTALDRLSVVWTTAATSSIVILSLSIIDSLFSQTWGLDVSATSSPLELITHFEFIAKIPGCCRPDTITAFLVSRPPLIYFRFRYCTKYATWLLDSNPQDIAQVQVQLQWICCRCSKNHVMVSTNKLVPPPIGDILVDTRLALLPCSEGSHLNIFLKVNKIIFLRSLDSMFCPGTSLWSFRVVHGAFRRSHTYSLFHKTSHTKKRTLWKEKDPQYLILAGITSHNNLLFRSQW